jgi:hypothetical protein
MYETDYQMKRSSLLWRASAISSAVIAIYAFLRSMTASMAASSIDGVPSQIAVLRRLGFLSYFWLGVSMVAVLMFIVSVFIIDRRRSKGTSS